ncbi:unnamed protein product [Chrysodeixis includens]|uniref:Uncharacterized protein n=1 Tax=Chrysodeixis includens TaxID=689277 RepID=A0A9P0BMZ4_CHRIL|nr:unnamed protein product [Chrysodeixis includens]
MQTRHKIPWISSCKIEAILVTLSLVLLCERARRAQYAAARSSSSDMTEVPRAAPPPRAPRIARTLRSTLHVPRRKSASADEIFIIISNHAAAARCTTRNALRHPPRLCVSPDVTCAGSQSQLTLTRDGGHSSYPPGRAYSGGSAGASPRVTSPPWVLEPANEASETKATNANCDVISDVSGQKGQT